MKWWFASLLAGVALILLWMTIAAHPSPPDYKAQEIAAQAAAAQATATEVALERNISSDIQAAPLEQAGRHFWDVLWPTALVAALLLVAWRQIGIIRANNRHAWVLANTLHISSSGPVPASRVLNYDPTYMAMLASIQRDEAAADLAEAQQQPVPRIQTITQSPVNHHAPVLQLRTDYRNNQAGLEQQAAPQLMPPGTIDMADLIAEGMPNQERLILAVSRDSEGQRRTITVPARRLPHIGIGGATDGGKTNILRLITAQAARLGWDIWLMSPHYMPLDPDTGEDWRTLARYCNVVYNKADIVTTIHDAAYRVLPQRQEQRRDDPTAPLHPALYVVDELLSVIDSDPRMAKPLGALLGEGRKYNMVNANAMTDALAKSLGISGPRDCWRTGFYVGGDESTARVLLDTRGRIDDGTLGKHLAWLRCATQPLAAPVVIPFASNRSIDMMLDGIPVPNTEQATQSLARTAPPPNDAEIVSAVYADNPSMRRAQAALGGKEAGWTEHRTYQAILRAQEQGLIQRD